MRPLGGMVFGYLGDKVVGREKALEFSIIVMAFPTVSLSPSLGLSWVGLGLSWQLYTTPSHPPPSLRIHYRVILR